jgi:hypothetical protein
MSGNEVVTNRQFTIPITIDGVQGSIISDGSSTITYDTILSLGGDVQKETRQVLDISLGEAYPTMVTIPGYRIQSEPAPPQTEGSIMSLFVTPPTTIYTVWYQVFVKTSSGQEIVVERRYSEFNMLDQLVRSQTASHLVASLPNLPGKVINPFTDQTSEPFIYRRRTALEIYLSMLLGNSKVMLIIYYQLKRLF